MFEFINKIFIALLIFSGTLATNCIPLNNEPSIFDLNQWTSLMSIYSNVIECNGSCNTLDDPSGRICLTDQSKI